MVLGMNISRWRLLSAYEGRHDGLRDPSVFLRKNPNGLQWRRWQFPLTGVMLNPLIPFRGDCAMKIYCASIVLCFCAMLCHAQATKTDQPQLSQVREKYDAPFTRNLQS